MIFRFNNTNFIKTHPTEIPNFQSKITTCCSWLESEMDLKIKGRIPEYKKHIGYYEKCRGNFGDGMYRCLLSFHEMNQIIFVYETLNNQSSDNFKSTVKKSVYGTEFNNTDSSRNYLFELLTATDYAKNGHNIDLEQQTDIIVNDLNMLVECKKVNSDKQLKKRIKEGQEQISKKRCKGVLHIDITEIFNELNAVFAVNNTGFPFSVMPPVLNETVENQLVFHVAQFLDDFIENEKAWISEQLDSNTLLAIILNYNYVGFHISLVEESVITGSYKIMFTTKKNNSSKELSSVKQTLGNQVANPCA